MKAPLSVVILLASPFLINALFPVKFRYFELVESGKNGLVGSIVFSVFYLILKLSKAKCLSYTIYDSLARTQSLISMIYTGFLLGVWSFNNMSFISSAFEASPSFFYYARFNGSISILTFSVSVLLEWFRRFRRKLSLLYSESPNNLELFLSPLSLLCISEYLALSAVFYLILCEKLFVLCELLFTTHPYLSVFLILVFFLSLALALVFLKLFKSKLKAKP